MALIQHEQHKQRSPQWQKVRDVVAGEDAVKAKGTAYLPMLASQAEEGGAGYDAYLLRAQFFNAAKRTMQGLVGSVMRTDPAIEGLDEALTAQVSRAVGREGQSLAHLASAHLRDLTTVGRAALLVDKAAGNAEGAKPYILSIKAESIVFWLEGERDGMTVPIVIAIEEGYEVPVEGDPIGDQTETKTQLRILRLGEPDPLTIELAEAGGHTFAGSSGSVYWQEIWRREEVVVGAAAAGMTRTAVIVPTKDGGRFWTEIPCDVVNAIGGITLETETPQMLDLANVLIGWYLNSADLEYGRHLCGVPQPCVAGFQVKEGEKLTIGCGFAWVSEETGATAWYLEFSGAGLGNLAAGLKEKEGQAALLAGRMLEAQPVEAEAFGTVKLRQAGSRSVLSTIADNGSEALSRAVRRWAQWQQASLDGDAGDAVTVTLESDFDAGILEPGRLTELTLALQKGSMSWETFVFNMRRGEVLPPDVSDEEERKRIQQGAPGRSRKDDILVMQADVAAGRLSLVSYLERLQTFGVYDGLDPQAELDRLAAEALDAQNRRFAAQAEFIKGQRPTGGNPPGETDDPEEDPKPPPGETKEAERETAGADRVGSDAGAVA